METERGVGGGGGGGGGGGVEIIIVWVFIKINNTVLLIFAVFSVVAGPLSAVGRAPDS